MSFLPDRADVYSILSGETLAMTGVAPLFVELCFKRPISRLEGDAGLPVREDLTWIFHLVFVGNVTNKSAAPLLALLDFTLAPLFLSKCATFCSLRLPYL